MRKIESLKELQKIELDILCFIDAISKENNLRYFLAGGTLLGAIRHKGFIPWDNDMDISMPRPDYDKFAEIFDAAANKLNSPYRVLKITNNGHYCCPFIKIVDTRTIVNDGEHQKFKGKNMGIFVDVFPIDSLPSNDQKSVQELFQVRNKCTQIALSFAKYDNLNLKEAIKLSIYKVAYTWRKRDKLLDTTQNILRKYNFYKSNYVVSTFGLREKKEIIDQKYFSNIIVVDFEGMRFPAPVGYHEYLTQMYGNYLQLPPEKDRVAPHDFEGYWLEETV